MGREGAIDELLVIRCQAGHRDAFDLLIRRWQRRFWQYARRLTGNDDIAWDVTQETWIVILGQIRKLDDAAWFAAWAYRIVRNKCADHCRKVSRQMYLAENLATQQTASGEPSSDRRCESVAEALRRLPPDRQELLALKYGEDLRIIEIAVVLGIPAGTVKSRLHQTREDMRRMLKGNES